MGIAIENGHNKSIDQKVLDLFPHYTVKTGEKQYRASQLRICSL
ncbi:MAG: hypothetical protein K0S04_1885 [Herbinix sp.]|jgi:hypothetical protein|nr:hypothetical protein [Herbinix sp.]